MEYKICNEKHTKKELADFPVDVKIWKHKMILSIQYRKFSSLTIFNYENLLKVTHKLKNNLENSKIIFKEKKQPEENFRRITIFSSNKIFFSL